MHEKLPSVINEAQEISAKSAALALKLQEMASILANTEQIITPLIYGATLFILTCLIGYYIARKIPPSLYIPFISLSSSISGIIIIASIYPAISVNFDLPSALGYAATFLVAFSIFGGFIITARLLKNISKISK